MPYQVKTLVDAVELGNQFIPKAQTVVTISDRVYQELSSRAFTGGHLQLIGQIASTGDMVNTQAAFVAPAAALGSAQVSAAPTQANFNALQTDVSALQSKVNALLTALQGANKPMASS